jgi:hypothetical protein
MCKKLLDNSRTVEAAELLRIFLSAAHSRPSLMTTKIRNEKSEVIDPASILWRMKSVNKLLGEELEEFGFSRGPAHDLSQYFRDAVAAEESKNDPIGRDKGDSSQIPKPPKSVIVLITPSEIPTKTNPLRQTGNFYKNNRQRGDLQPNSREHIQRRNFQQHSRTDSAAFKSLEQVRLEIMEKVKKAAEATESGSKSDEVAKEAAEAKLKEEKAKEEEAKAEAEAKAAANSSSE